MRRTGHPRGLPWIDGEQANACARGCNACVARVAREGHSGSTVSRANACARGEPEWAKRRAGCKSWRLRSVT